MMGATGCGLIPEDTGLVLVVTGTDTLVPKPGTSTFVDPTIVLSDSAGTLFVVDIGSATIHVIAPSGEPLREIGRRGSGPGEVLFPGPIALNHDTLLVVDAPNGMLSSTAPRTVHSSPVDDCLPPRKGHVGTWRLTVECWSVQRDLRESSP
jgi:DNA-binding beta-propeller fold protein YncE